MEEMKLNILPSPTWRWLEMNYKKYKAADLSEGGALTEVVISGAKSECPQLDSVSGGMGDDFALISKKFTERSYRVAAGDSAEIFLKAEPDKPAVSENIDIVVESGASLTFFLDLASQKEASIAVRAGIRVKKDGTLKVVRAVCGHASAKVITDIGIDAEDKANVEVVDLFLGGDVTAACRIDLSGEGAALSEKVGYFLKQDDELDLNYIVNHRARETKSDIYATGVLDGNAKKTLRATIDLKDKCAGSAGHELEEVLLKSDDAVCKSIPVILCEEEDVEGSHGASIGDLDEDLVFYLETRGFTRDEVYDMVVAAKLKSIAREIPAGDLRDRFVSEEEDI